MGAELTGIQLVWCRRLAYFLIWDLDSLKGFNQSATEWAVEHGEYHVDSGISGPSMGDVMKKWKVHKLSLIHI